MQHQQTDPRQKRDAVTVQIDGAPARVYTSVYGAGEDQRLIGRGERAHTDVPARRLRVSCCVRPIEVVSLRHRIDVLPLAL